jgi:hypothetical protein
MRSRANAHQYAHQLDSLGAHHYAPRLTPDSTGVQMESSRTRTRSPAPGVVAKHARTCASSQGKRCSCEPGYQAWSYDRRSNKKIYKTFPSLAEAKR